MQDSPFELNHPSAYERWRDTKLTETPAPPADPVVVRDLCHPSPAEQAALRDRCRRGNWALYVTQGESASSKHCLREFGAQFGLIQLDHNRGTDDDAVTSLTVQTGDYHRIYIPYTNRAIAWHTDGYYNSPDRQIRALLLHSVQPAASGGENDLLDHEILYLLLRDQNPEHIRALMHPEAMTIPPNQSNGETLRGAETGPVFSVGCDGRLHMRYTRRQRNILWRDDVTMRAAVAALEAILDSPTPWHFRGRLEAGWGLLANNVLHTRHGFQDGGVPRLLYRARYLERIAGT
ncbi:MAG: TauD/TfdA family dioxygenase [Pseudomonadota bacterium]